MALGPSILKSGAHGPIGKFLPWTHQTPSKDHTDTRILQFGCPVHIDLAFGHASSSSLCGHFLDPKKGNPLECPASGERLEQRAGSLGTSPIQEASRTLFQGQDRQSHGRYGSLC